MKALPGGIQARARLKVGSSNLARLAWLLDLLNHAERIAEASASERAEIEAEVVAFSRQVGAVRGGQQSVLSRERLFELARHIRADFHALPQGATLEFEIPAVTFVCTPDRGTTFLGSAEALFRLAIAKLLEAEQARIKTCARNGCENLFARRKRGLYCSRQCAQIEHLARYVARHGGSVRTLF